MKITRLLRRRWCIALVCVAFAVLPPAVALATNTTYASGMNGVGGAFNAHAFNSYTGNLVWHAQGYFWVVDYILTDGTRAGEASSSNNPTAWGGSIGYGNPECNNANDSSGVTWTCQYQR